MFNFSNKSIPKNFQDSAKDISNMEDHATKTEKEYYRVGLTTDGRTTLTIMDDNRFSITLSLTPEGCERLIRILRSTYETDESTNDIPESQSA